MIGVLSIKNDRAAEDLVAAEWLMVDYNQEKINCQPGWKEGRHFNYSTVGFNCQAAVGIT